MQDPEVNLNPAEGDPVYNPVDLEVGCDISWSLERVRLANITRTMKYLQTLLPKLLYRIL